MGNPRRPDAMFAAMSLVCAVAAAIAVYLYARATFFGGNEVLSLYAAIALTLAAAVVGLSGIRRTRQRADDLVTAMLAISIVIACMGGLVLLGLIIAETNGP